MNRYAAAASRHPLATHAVGEVAGEILDALGGTTPDLLVWFMTPHHVGTLDEIHGALRSLLTLLGIGPAAHLRQHGIAIRNCFYGIGKGCPFLRLVGKDLPDAIGRVHSP